MDKRKFYILSFLGILAVVFFIVARNNNPGSIGLPAFLDIEKTGQEDAPGQTKPVAEIDPDALLPDLEVKPLAGAYIVTRRDGNRRLRFPGTFANTGDGPLELTGTYDKKSGTTRAVQHMYKKDGAKNERFVGNFIFHAGHDHWHFEDFVEFELWSLKEEKELDQRLLTTGKVTYCLHDYGPLPDEYAGKPSSIVYPWCGSSADIQGISVGWVDTYLAEVPGQELDISSIGDGIYAFRSVVDPQDRIIEKNENNNISVSFIAISGNTVRIAET